ncbi:hypothetical protein [Streptomyces antimicrobicus]|uniref:Uncharacterized protein n=1 Tax=Streptomyces antimicrobicus TaxID=2883108 RepID=A0ABS8B4U2_9ACTN|nr:hypothetical protein [Streptomyces antimicrobicus]MCB5179583.1 hypothetical protein [Streptomyces antimicrobicus]
MSSGMRPRRPAEHPSRSVGPQKAFRGPEEQRRPHDSWRKDATWHTVARDDRRVCAACGALVRSYQYRFHPPESSMFERCIAFAWCPVCRVYVSHLVHIPREQVLVDALAVLPSEQRARLLRSETRLVAYLDRQARRGSA